MHRFVCLAVAGAAALLIGPAAGRAAPITFSGSSGSLAASATFDVQGNNLIVTLTNTSNTDITMTSQLLTGVFFDIGGNPTLTPVSATLGAGSTTVKYQAGAGSGTDPGGVVGGEWAYATGAQPGGLTQDYALVSAGYASQGQPSFPGTNLEGPVSVDGAQYGITSAGDDPNTANGGLQNDTIIKNSVVFTLSGAAGLDPSLLVSNVRFQYGTDLSEPSFPGGGPPPGPTPPPPPPPPPVVPVPPAVLLMSMGGIGLALAHLRRRRLAA